MKKFLSLILILFSLQMTVQASHLSGGSIHYECIGFGQYVLTIVNYRDCSGITMPPTMNVNYTSTTCGASGIFILPLQSSQEVTPICAQLQGQTTCTPGGFYVGLEEYIYSDTITMPANCTDWMFSQTVCCWDNSNVNIPGNTFSYHAQSSLNDLDFVCNSNVQFGNIGMMYASLNQPNVYDPQGADADGDELRYRLVDVMQALNAPGFYIPPFNGQTPLNVINSMDSTSGRIEFVPNALGSFVVAYDVDEYRNGVLIATTHRVIKIVVVNTPPSSLPVGGVSSVSGGYNMGDTIVVCQGSSLNFDYVVTDPDPIDSIAILHNLGAELPGATYSSVGSNPLTFNVQWVATQAGVYQVGLTIENTACPAPSSSQLADITIFVTGGNSALSVTDFYLCSTDTIEITAPSGFLTYSWNTGDTTESIQVTTAGVYDVTTTGGNCGNNYFSTEIYDDPPFDIGIDTSIYLGDSIQLQAVLGNGLVPGAYIDTTVVDSISSAGVTTIDLNVQNVFPGVVGLDVLDFITTDITALDALNNLELYLVAPNTVMIPLAIRRGGINDTGYNNSSFDPDVTDAIANYNNPLSTVLVPADSVFIPEGVWSNLDGSGVNGLWQLAVRHTGGGSAGAIANYFGMQFDGAFDYQWTPATGLSCTDCPNPWVSPDTTTTYVLETSNAFGCTTYDTITISVQPRWQADTVEYVIAEDSLLQICATLPTGFGTITADTVLTMPIHGTLTADTATCYFYQASSSAEVNDTLIILACNAQGFCDTTVVIVHTVSCVWAGDANDDNIVTNYDILPIGLGYGAIGDLRPNAGIDFDCEPHFDWNQSTPVTNVDYKHADTDGNGIVDANDTLAIAQNWGMMHLRPGEGSPASANQSPFLVGYASSNPGATIRLPILLGDQANPVDSAYGLAYTIFYDQTMVDTNSVMVDFDTSWLGTEGVDMITIHKNFYNNGQLQIGMSRTDHQPVSGYGQIGTLQFTIKDDIIRRNSANLHLIMGIGQVRFIDEMENTVDIEGQPSYVVILRADDPTGVEEILGNQIQLFPNPASNRVILQSSQEDIERIRLFNGAGQLLHSAQPQTLEHQLNVSELASGIYQLEIQTASGLQHRRLIKK